MYLAVAALSLLIAYLVYRYLIEPKKLMNHYQKLFKSKGYNTIKMQYMPLSTPFYDEWFNDQVKYKDPMYKHKTQYTSVQVMISNHLTNPSLVLMNPEMIKETFQADKFMVLEKEKKMFGIWMSIFGNGMLGSQRQDWKQKRKLLSKVFTYDFIVDSIPMIVNLADNVFNQFENQYWGKHPELKYKGEFQVEISEMMKRFTSSIIVSQFLGVSTLKDQLDSLPIADGILKMSHMASNMIPDPLVMVFGQKFVNKGWRKSDREYLEVKNRVRSSLREHVLEEEEKSTEDNDNNPEQLKETKQKSIVKLLFEQRKKDAAPFDISIDYIVNQIITFVLAGTDSTTSFLASMMLLIFEKPAVAQRLRQQINSVIKSDQDINVKNFKKLPYLECCINQTSRMVSSIINSFTKTASEDMTLGGVPIKKGTLIDCSWLNTFYNPETFQNPMEFMPERWQKEESNRNQGLISMIFSGGPRSCIGRSLALTNIRVMTIKFMQRYANVVEVNRKDRQFQFIVSYCIKNTQSIVTKIKA